MGIDSVSELLPLGEFFPTSEVVEALERSLHVVPADELFDDPREAGESDETGGTDGG